LPLPSSEQYCPPRLLRMLVTSMPGHAQTKIGNHKRELSDEIKKSRDANAEKVFQAVKKAGKKKKGKAAKPKQTLQEKAAEVNKLFKDGCVL